MFPILTIRKSIAKIGLVVSFFFCIFFVPVYAQDCGTPYYGTADGDLLSGAECTAGLQTPSISKECASCNVKNMPGFRDFFVGSGMGKCNNLQIMNYWVHGGIGAAGPHNFYDGDIGPGICKCVCACELADHNADCTGKPVIIAPTTKPTLIPPSIPISTTPRIPTMRPTFIPTIVLEESPSPSSYQETEIIPSPTEEAIQMKFGGSSLTVDTPQTNTIPNITLPRINIEEKATAIIQFFTSLFINFFKTASF